MSSSKERVYYPQIDALRFFAFLLVFLHHTPPVAGSAVSFFVFLLGAYGVDLFFVISAFLLFDLLCKEYDQHGRINVAYFFLRRVLRIWPLYFFFLLIAIVWTAAVSGFGAIDTGRLLGLLFFVDNITTFTTEAFNPLFATGHLWTISTEEQFYLIVPALSLLFCTARPRVTAAVLSALFVSSIALRAIALDMGSAHPSLWVMHVTHLEPFVLGFGLGYLHNRRSIPKWAGLVGLALFVAIPLYVYNQPDSYRMLHPHGLFAPTASGIALAGLVAFAIADFEILRPVLHSRSLAFLGRLSYGLYVWHVLVKHICTHWLAGFVSPGDPPIYAWGVAFFPSLALSIAVAAASYYAVEMPFLRLKSRFTFIHNR